MSAPINQLWHGRSSSPKQTQDVGRVIGAAAAAGDVIALEGELGAGKTQFVRGFAQGVGVSPSEVASPTYVLVHEYPTTSGRPVLVHIDAYRLQGRGDLESIGWTAPGGGELREGAIVVVEWADRIGDHIGDDALTVTLSHSGETTRDVMVRGSASWAGRWAALAAALRQVVGAAEPVTRPCPICKASVAMECPSFPFCSKRCRVIDLSKWASGDYRISRPIEEADLDEE